VVDDLRASPEALLSSLHQADVRTLDVLVVTRAGAAAATDVRALLSRFPPRLVLAPAGHRLPGEVVVPPPGSEVAAGGVILTLHLEDRRLAVSVTTPGAHHQGTGSRSSSSSSVPKRSSRL
jgi:hypothetical protein